MSRINSIIDGNVKTWFDIVGNKLPRAKKPVKAGHDWDFSALEDLENVCMAVGDIIGADCYKNQIEVITADQMMNAYASIGMPVNYNHWSFGKKYLQTEGAYRKGQMGLAYEIIINSDPCIAYLMEENTVAMQALVIAHACIGHNDFFKNNYLFKMWTDASFIIEYLCFAKRYIKACEEKVGAKEVELFLDSCHALMNMGVFRYKRPTKGDGLNEIARLKEMEEHFQKGRDPVLDTVGRDALAEEKEMLARTAKSINSRVDYSNGGCENLMYVLEKESPAALSSMPVGGSPWKVELLRIVRMISQYFYPQKQTQVMNEGWACTNHYAILHILHEYGYITDAQLMELMHSHTGVVAQPAYNSPYYSGINPYHLGFNMFQDLMFMARGPRNDEERKIYQEGAYEEVFANTTYDEGKCILGGDVIGVLRHAMKNFKDESFISQYLSPNLNRDLGLFTIKDDEEQAYLEIKNIAGGPSTPEGLNAFYEQREDLAAQYNLSNLEPDIVATGLDHAGDRTLELKYTPRNDIPLGASQDEVLKHIGSILRGNNEFPAYKVSLSEEDPETGISYPISENSNSMLHMPASEPAQGFDIGQHGKAFANFIKNMEKQ